MQAMPSCILTLTVLACAELWRSVWPASGPIQLNMEYPNMLLAVNTALIAHLSPIHPAPLHPTIRTSTLIL